MKSSFHRMLSAFCLPFMLSCATASTQDVFEGEGEQSVTLMSLPPEMRERVFSQSVLSQADLLQLQRVSKDICEESRQALMRSTATRPLESVNKTIIGLSTISFKEWLQAAHARGDKNWVLKLQEHDLLPLSRDFELEPLLPYLSVIREIDAQNLRESLNFKPENFQRFMQAISGLEGVKLRGASEQFSRLMIPLWKDFPNLRYIRFSLNFMTQARFNEIVEKCTQLEKVAFEGGRKSFIEDYRGLAKLKNLSHLNLRGVKLRSADLESIFSSCANLKVLHMSGRNLDESMTEDPKGSGLKTLASIAKLSQLEELVMTDTEVNDAVLRQIVLGCPKLKHLDLRGSKKLRGAIQAISGLNHLETLYLGYASIASSGSEHPLTGLSGLQKLKYLDLSGISGIKADDFVQIAELPNLKQLVLSQTAIDDLGLKAIAASCKSLEDFELAECHGLSADALTSLAGLSELTFLDLCGVGVNDNVLAVLIPALPKLHRFHMDKFIDAKGDGWNLLNKKFYKGLVGHLYTTNSSGLYSLSPTLKIPNHWDY
ncbi:MAG: leucine-rich repeat domain-containing protein [Holosporales bacterium]